MDPQASKLKIHIHDNLYMFSEKTDYIMLLLNGQSII